MSSKDLKQNPFKQQAPSILNEINEIKEAETKQKQINLETEIDQQFSKITDVITLDETVILSAMEIIKDNNIKDIQIKELLLKLLSYISDYRDITKTLIAEKNNNLVAKFKSTSLLRVSSEKEKVVKLVQDHLTREYQDLMYNVLSDKQIKETLETNITSYVTQQNLTIEGMSQEDTIKELIQQILGLPVIEPYLYEPDGTAFDDFTEEIMINDYNDVRIIKGGQVYTLDKAFDSPADLETLVNKLMALSGSNQEFNQQHPSVKLRIGATTRVTLVRDPLARRAPVISNILPAKDREKVFVVRIRKQRTVPFTLDDIMKKGSIGEYTKALLETGTRYGARILFYGGTGSGKTATMTASAYNIDAADPVITIAEVDEMDLLKIDQRQHIEDTNGETIVNPRYMKPMNNVVMLEIPNQELEVSSGYKGYDGALVLALTMTPKVIIMQEAKGKEMGKISEAAQTGHQVMTTMHADDGDACIKRTSKMIKEANDLPTEDILEQIAISFDLIVEVKRLKDGSRKITAITEVLGYNHEKGRIDLRVLDEYKITDVTEVKGKVKYNGYFCARDLPSEKLRYRYQMYGGMPNSVWDNLTSVMNSNKK